MICETTLRIMAGDYGIQVHTKNGLQYVDISQLDSLLEYYDGELIDTKVQKMLKYEKLINNSVDIYLNKFPEMQKILIWQDGLTSLQKWNIVNAFYKTLKTNTEVK